MVSKLAKYFAMGLMSLNSVLPVSLFANGKENKLEKVTTELNGPTSWETIGNTFSQPNVHMQLGRNKLDWYGSGDVNNDEVIDSKDLTAMNSGIKNDRSDVDGDGNSSTSNDKKVLGDYLNRTISYLPGHWNSLTTEGERVNWLEKMIKINDPSKYVLNSNNVQWQCRNFIHQMEIDFYGVSNIDQFIQEQEAGGEVRYHKEDNAKFNIPLQYFSTVNTSLINHAISGILVGDNPLDFNDWYFVGFEDDDKVYPGDYAMDGNHYAKMVKIAYIEDPDFYTKYFDSVQNLLNFNLDNNQASVSFYQPEALTLKNPNDFTVDVIDPKDKTLNYQVNLDTSPSVTGTPSATSSNGLEVILNYNDGSPVPTNSKYPGIEYYFDRTWTGEATSISGVTKSDTEIQRINVKDKLNPYGVVPTDINLTKEQVDANGGLSPAITGNMTGVGDNTNLPVEINVNYQLVSENSDKQVYNAFFTLTDVIGNDTTYSPQKVNIYKAKINMNQLEDILVNAENPEQDLRPEVLEAHGFNAEPEVTTANTTSTYTVNYTQSEKSNSIDYPWADRDITTTFVASLDNGEAADTMQYKIKVRDKENPRVNNLEKITITKDDSLHPTITGYPKITDNVAVKDTTIWYELNSEDEVNKYYKAMAKVTDVFGNDSTYHYQDVVVDKLVPVENDGPIVNKYELKQNYPNPFNPTTTIEYSTRKYGDVTLDIYDIKGEKIESRSKRGVRGEGKFELDMSKYSSGTYFYRLNQKGEAPITKKLMLVK